MHDYLFCHVDDFCQQFELQWQQKLLYHGAVSPIRAKSLCLSEIMTILRSIIENINDQLKKPSLRLDWFLPQFA
jgi:hypothetical protein